MKTGPFVMAGLIAGQLCACAGGQVGTETAASVERVGQVAQPAALSASDSALIGRILLAEDRRDSTDAALAEGSRHADVRVRLLAQRARGRLGDPRFAARDSFTGRHAPAA